MSENSPAVGAPVQPSVMQRDEALEAVCDKIRSGEPVGILEALAAINYQENLRREREAKREANSLVARLKRWLRAA